MTMELPRIRSSGELKLSYWRDGHIDSAALSESFDHAVETYNPVEMRELASLIRETEGRHSFKSVQTRMRAISVPAFEKVYALYNNLATDENLEQKLDDMHSETIALLASEVEHGERIFDIKGEHPGGTTGIVSELAIMALLNRNGRYSNHIALPASDLQDKSDKKRYGALSGIDFTVYPRHDYLTPIKTQVKTSYGYKGAYLDDILVVPLTQIVNDGESTHEELAERARVRLPHALINYENGDATPAERRLVGQADLQLAHLLREHRNYLSQAS